MLPAVPTPSVDSGRSGADHLAAVPLRGAGLLSAGLIGAALVCGLAIVDPAVASSRPDKITKVWVTQGAVGTFTVHWKAGGKHTTGYAIETGLTSFSKTDTSKPRHGRNAKNFYASSKSRSFTFTAAALRRAGAPLGSGNHLYFRISAMKKTKSRTDLRYYPYLQAAMPKSAAPSGSVLRVGSFNVRTAHAPDKRSWLQRSGDVARTITAHRLAVASLQELNVGRADGKSGSTTGHPRQTDSLITALHTVGGSRYRLVRTTPYVKAGTPQASQGARILYDSSRLRLDSSCPEKTGSSSYSPSCSIALPIAKGDSTSRSRRAAYAWFTDRSTGRRFIFVSVHLDERHTGSATTRRTHDQLRTDQIATIYRTLTSKNRAKVPIIIGGDYNSWQNFDGGNGPHDYLIGKSFTDSVAATSQINLKYSTLNDFAVTVRPTTGPAFASRLDMILSHGMHGSKRFENVVKVKDTKRPSDHNLIYADLVY